MDQIRTICAGIFLLGLGLTASAVTNRSIVATPAVHIEFFFESGCDNCQRVENEILPELEGLFGGFYTLARFDVGIMTNSLRLAGYQEQLGIKKDEDVSMVVNGRVMLNGLNEIRNRLLETMDRALAGDLNPLPAAPEGIKVKREPGSTLEKPLKNILHGTE